MALVGNLRLWTVQELVSSVLLCNHKSIQDETVRKVCENFQYLDMGIFVHILSGSKMNGLLNKKDIMSLYKCKSDKALRLLKFMYDVGYANKFGKEYYVTSEALDKFLADYAGKNVMI